MGLVVSAEATLTAPEVRKLSSSETADKDIRIFASDTAVNERGDIRCRRVQPLVRPWQGERIPRREGTSAAVAAERTIDIQSDANLPIPDVGEPVISSIDIDEDGTLTELRIQVNISHTYIGDLRVDLIAPDNSVVVLHNNTGGSTDNIVRTYSVHTPALRPLLDKPIRGKWQLQVKDTFRLDIGRLNRWRIAARVASPQTEGAPELR